MKTLSSKARMRAFTLVELLLLIFIIAVLAALLMPVGGSKMKARLAACEMNQKQIAVGLFVWANEHHTSFPWHIPCTNGGSMEISANGDTAGTFRTLSVYSRNLRVFRCPSDRERIEATNINEMDNTNTSYFIALDPGRLPAESILIGDRHLEANGGAVKPGLFVYSTNKIMNWTRELHATSKVMGSLTFYDGHVELFRGPKLNAVFLREGLSTNSLAVP